MKEFREAVNSDQGIQANATDYFHLIKGLGWISPLFDQYREVISIELIEEIIELSNSLVHQFLQTFHKIKFVTLRQIEL